MRRRSYLTLLHTLYLIYTISMSIFLATSKFVLCISLYLLPVQYLLIDITMITQDLIA